MTNLQKIQQETSNIFDQEFTSLEVKQRKYGWVGLRRLFEEFLHSRESIAYKAGYDEGYADCANDVKKLSK
jgi:hypothetical protein